jgi:hypothetical protein
VLGVIELYSGEALRPDADLLATMSALGDQIGQALERRRDVEALQAKDARHRAMLETALDCVVTMDHRRARHRLQPRGRAHLRLPRERRRRSRHGGAPRPAHAARPSSSGLARYVDGGQGSMLDRRIDITGHARRRHGVPGRADHHADRRARAADVRGGTCATSPRARPRRRSCAPRGRGSSKRPTTRGRRLERDLHDGAQQRLVELALDLRMAQARLAEDPAETRELLDGALEVLAAATAELRELARGIHPAALTEGGLRFALDALVTRSRVPARVDGGSRPALPARRRGDGVLHRRRSPHQRGALRRRPLVEVTAEHAGGRLRVEVRDDGRGGADPAAGSGLRGLADRAAALGGELSLTSPPGGGTLLTVEIPCES